MRNLVPTNGAFELKSCRFDGHFDGTSGIPFTLSMVNGDRNNKVKRNATPTRVRIEVVPASDAHLRLRKTLRIILAATDRDDHPDSKSGDLSTTNGPRSQATTTNGSGDDTEPSDPKT